MNLFFILLAVSILCHFFPFSDNSLLKRSHLLPRSQICLLLFLTRYRHHNRWPIHVCLPRERNQLPICPFCLACLHGIGNTLPTTAISHWRPRFVVFICLFKRLRWRKCSLLEIGNCFLMMLYQDSRCIAMKFVSLVSSYQSYP